MSPIAPDARDLLVIVGPTAAGKSALAMDLCERVGGEIVSADSVQVYRDLNIGSAKPTTAERQRVTHHCIDMVAPSERMDAARWATAADAAIAETLERGKVPVVCGGTGLYVRALLHGLVEVPPVESSVRDAVLRELEAVGPEILHERLKVVDPLAAQRIQPRDSQRIARAIEVFRQTGRPLGQWQSEHGFADARYRANVVVLWPERETLYGRITGRATGMLASGLVKEVSGLLTDGVS